ncbi:2-carboxy-1,4-naphthoquinone phytyltransferase [Prochlorococcus sp. MIT 1223]|uniref:2-carboxy-1,4-naphthoquinone phytyltransferase n=1 Tax=Prochlorococcus sp. MIT 1223 TaxID=3096217 RepID=UPI002A748C5D|nr:2-carboxy-1,4-naphthoquinone phytyltransferase [Prochlorococcus sp. MIT 1223]
MRYTKKQESVKLSKTENKRLWQAAIKWPLYSVAIMPVFLAGSWAYANGQPIRWEQFFGFLIAAILLLIWENLTNDIFDADTGVDQFKLHSVVALVGRRQLIARLAYLSLGLGLLLIFLLGTRSNPYVLPLVMGSCFLGYVYQGPPFRLGYQGLGEPLCWLAFGPFATSAALLVISPSSQYQNHIPWSTAGLIGSGPALATTLVLFCSHFHQTVQDAAHGKKTSLVRLGTHRAANLVPWLIVLILVLEIVPIFTRSLPISALLGLIALPSGMKLINLLKKHHNFPELISDSKFLALRFQTLNGFGLCLGFTLAPYLESNIGNLIMNK